MLLIATNSPCTCTFRNSQGATPAIAVAPTNASKAIDRRQWTGTTQGAHTAQATPKTASARIGSVSASEARSAVR